MVRRLFIGSGALLAALVFSACGGGGTAASGSDSDATTSPFSAQASLGEKIFNDISLSSSGRQSCATCHVATSRHAADNDFTRQDDAFARMTLALQLFQREDTIFRAFSSKYDEFLRGSVSLSEQELRGFALFNSPAKDNCAVCHPSDKNSDGSHPLFTDFTYDNLGIPRNPDLLQNADPTFFTAKSFADLGPGLTPSAAATEQVVTLGANLQVAQGIVVKADVQRFRENSDANRLNLGLGWSSDAHHARRGLGTRARASEHVRGRLPECGLGLGRKADRRDLELQTRDRRREAHRGRRRSGATKWNAGVNTTGRAASWVLRARPLLGTIFGHAGADDAVSAAFESVANIQAQLSRFEPASDIARFHTIPSGTNMAIGEHAQNVLLAAQALRHETRGLFDISLGTAPEGWRCKGSGLMLCGVAGLLALTGYLLYYFAPEGIRPQLGWLHAGIGGLMGVLLLHRRPKSRHLRD